MVLPSSLLSQCPRLPPPVSTPERAAAGANSDPSCLLPLHPSPRVTQFQSFKLINTTPDSRLCRQMHPAASQARAQCGYFRRSPPPPVTTHCPTLLPSLEGEEKRVGEEQACHRAAPKKEKTQAGSLGHPKTAGKVLLYQEIVNPVNVGLPGRRLSQHRGTKPQSEPLRTNWTSPALTSESSLS